MREYNNYQKNEIVEVKKPKIYLLTSKVVNLLAVFVASISVSTFFATRYIGVGDLFFSANVFSTMLAMALLVVILEIYGKKNSIKAFMAGAYAILLIFFISAFIPDFNPLPIGYTQTSFINFHQKILLCVFISYVISFLLCIKVYLYMKNELDIPYLWIKVTPAITIAQIVYTISYYLIYYGFSSLEYASIDIKNELYLKFFMLIIDVIIVYFIISGIKSGFFDLTKNIFSSQNNNMSVDYEDNQEEYRPIKKVFDETPDDLMSFPSNKPMYLEDYSSKKRNRRYLPDYSEEDQFYSRRNNIRSYADNEENDDFYNNSSSLQEEAPIRRTRRNLQNRKQNTEAVASTSRRSNRRALSRQEVSARSNRRGSNLISSEVNSNDFNQENSSISRNRSNRNNNTRSLTSRAINNRQKNNDGFFQEQLNNQSNQTKLGNQNINYSTGINRNINNGSLLRNNSVNPINPLQNKRITPRSSQSFFVNQLTPNNLNNSSPFNVSTNFVGNTNNLAKNNNARAGSLGLNNRNNSFFNKR